MFSKYELWHDYTLPVLLPGVNRGSHAHPRHLFERDEAESKCCQDIPPFSLDFSSIRALSGFLKSRTDEYKHEQVFCEYF